MLRTWLNRPQHALVSIPARQKIPTLANNDNGIRRPYSNGVQPRFSYQMAASASPKKARLYPAEHGLSFWTSKNVERDPPVFSSVEQNSGQDAFFMAHVARSKRHVVFSVADGVGGWEESGINPAAFSHGMCKYMAEATLYPQKEQDLRPVNLMNKGYISVEADKKISAGGSTAVVAVADPSGYMEVANLGDSGVVILSPGRVKFKSPPQTSNFNTPFQLSKFTEQMKLQHSIFGGGMPIQDKPSKSDITHHDLSHGDVVIMGTDGLWDNLSAMEVLQIVGSLMNKGGYWKAKGDSETLVDEAKVRSLLFPSKPADDIAARLAYAIMKEAKVTSRDTKRDGPFAKEVHRWFPHENYHGGKVDDIAVIATIAVQDGDGSIKAKL